MINSLAEIQEYFRRIADIHPDIRDFVAGDSEKILSLDRSKLDYPVLWLETPSLSWTFGNNSKGEMALNFVVLINSPTDAWQHQQYILNRTLEITEQIIGKIYEDSDDGFLNLLGKRISADPILGYGHDHDYGWRVRLIIERTISVCADPCKFLPSFSAAHEIASFTWSNTNDGDFTVLSVAQSSVITNLDTTQWTWQIDNGSTTTSATPPPSNIGAGSTLFVTLHHTDTSGVNYYASAIFDNAMNCGTSVPYLIDKSYC